MNISYKKLWKLLIDRDMKKKGLEKAADISNYVISKMTRNENITVETVRKICKALNRARRQVSLDFRGGEFRRECPTVSKRFDYEQHFEKNQAKRCL